MQITDCGDDPLHDCPGLALREELLPDNLVEELAAAHVVEDEADLVAGLEHVAQGDHILKVEAIIIVASISLIFGC